MKGNQGGIFNYPCCVNLSIAQILFRRLVDLINFTTKEQHLYILDCVAHPNSLDWDTPNISKSNVSLFYVLNYYKQ